VSWLSDTEGDVVLIHGLGNHSGLWLPQQPLSDTYRLITPDLQGVTVRDMALQVIDMLSAPSHICGISLGGLVAQEIYRQRPDLVQSLMLVNTYSYVPWWMRSTVLNQWERALELMDDDTYTSIAARNCLHSNDADKLLMAQQSFSIDRETIMDTASDAVQVNYMPLLPFISVPTLVIGSRYDKVVPWYSGWYTHLWIPGARYQALDAGHLCNIDAADEFNAVVREFIRKGVA
jgi:3-oxoadipate enol-lactonase